MTTVSAEDAARFASAAETGAIPGQTTVDDHLEPDQPHDDPDHPGWSGRDEFVAEAGEATGDLSAQQPRPVQETVYVEEIRVDGTSQTALDVGGKRASECVVNVSGKVVVDGFYRKGDRIEIVGGCLLITSATVKDKIDKQTGIVTEAVQSHAGKLIDLEVA